MAVLQHGQIIATTLSTCDLTVGPGIRGPEYTICHTEIEPNGISRHALSVQNNLVLRLR